MDLSHLNRRHPALAPLRIGVLLVFAIVAITGCKQVAFVVWGLGASTADKGRYERSIGFYNVAIKILPNFPDAYRSRGDAWLHMGDRQKALSDYNKTIVLGPDWAPAYDSRGNFWVQGGETIDGMADYAKAIALDPNYVDAYFDRGSAFILYAKDYGKAVGDFTKVIELGDDRGYGARGLALTYNGDFTKAIEDFNVAIERFPNRAYLYKYRGDAWAKAGNRENAQADFTKAKQLGWAE